MTNEQLEKARKQMRQWLTLTPGRRTRAERVTKWRELVRDVLEEARIRKEAAQKAKTTRARRKKIAEQFKAYRPGKQEP